jgi:hypothetical protein
MKLLAALDAQLNQLQNTLAHIIAGDPGSPVEGQFWYNSVAKRLKYRNDTASIVVPKTANDLSVPTADVAWGSNKITGLADPASAQDAATKAYVDASAQGLDTKASVRVATTANITLSAPQTIDGVSVIAGDRVLVKNQTTGSQNGIYVVAAGAWARAADADTSAEVNAGMYTFVEEGTINGDSGWVLTTNNPITLATTALTFSQFSGAGSTSASNVNVGGVGVYKQQTGSNLEFRGVNAGSTKVSVTNDAANNEIDVDVVEANLSHANIGGVTPIANGGTGATTAAAARTALAVPTIFAQDIGDGSSTSIVVTHNLGTKDVLWQLYDKTTPFSDQMPDFRRTSTTTATLVFSVAPTTNQYRVVIMG